MQAREMRKSKRKSENCMSQGSNARTSGPEASWNAAFHSKARRNPSICRRRRTTVTTVFSGHLRRSKMKFFPEIDKLYMVGKLLWRRIRISCSFILNLTNTHGSKGNIIDIKNSSSYIKLIPHPFSKQDISTCLGELDLYIHGKKLAK